MKLIELLNKIANGEIKEGAKFKFVKYPQMYGVGIDYFVFGTANLNDEVEIIEEKQQQGRWKPKEEGTAYFSINDWGVIFQTHYNNAPQDWFRILNKNVFKTDSEAKEYLEYKTALLEAEKPFELKKDNWYFALADGKVEVVQGDWFQQAVIIFLGQDVAVAQAFVDKWYKQILKYEFCIEE
jgi:hypothetical protein